jgi:hypothetical protein
MKTKYKVAQCCIILWVASTAFQFRQPSNQSRYDGNTIYTVLDSTGFYLYQRYEPVEAAKGKGTVMKTDYFFSKDAQGAVLPLTFSNIEKAFAANTRFRYLLEGHFCRNEDLISYDPFLKEYKIKYLYAQSLQ